MLKCNNCYKEFYEAKETHTTYENFYGVSSLFGNSHRLIILTCPYCDSEEIEEIDEDEETN